MSCWRLSVDQLEREKLLGATVLEGAQTLSWLLHLGIYQILTVKIQERYPGGSGRGRGRIIFVKYVQSLPHNKQRSVIHGNIFARVLSQLG